MTEMDAANRDHETSVRLARFVAARLKEARGTIGPARTINEGLGDLVTAFTTILPHVRNAGPEYSPGVVDGLRNGLAYVAARFCDHPDFEELFRPQAPATVSEWPQ
ncbi:hypothetical protein [Streptomyces sp. NPDC051219]|uniref:hypothetical protein n=1 Tax=Streptomyces sp. NPDC051219 TaxID=3155283 RepID=UPI0034275813